jgi:hypothetical protein
VAQTPVAAPPPKEVESVKQSLAATFFAALIAFAAHAQQPGMRAQVVMVESLVDFERWAEQRLTEGTYPRALREVPVGIPVHFPIVVTGLQQGANALELVADIEFYAPSGNSLGLIQKCCRFSAAPNSNVRAAVLGNAATLVFAANDMRGRYAVAVSVTDGTRTVKTREEFNFGKAEEPAKPAARPAPPAPPPQAAPRPEPAPRKAEPAPAKKPEPAPPKSEPAPAKPEPAAPKLRMAPPPEKEPGRDADKRDCLALPTPAEIIKCAEKKR